MGIPHIILNLMGFTGDPANKIIYILTILIVVRSILSIIN